MATGTLSNPVTIVIWAAWAVLLAYKLGPRPGARLLVPAAIVFMIPVGAWTARNYAIAPHLVFRIPFLLPFGARGAGAVSTPCFIEGSEFQNRGIYRY